MCVLSGVCYTHVFQAVSGSRTADKQRCETLSVQGESVEIKASAFFCANQGHRGKGSWKERLLE